MKPDSSQVGLRNAGLRAMAWEFSGKSASQIVLLIASTILARLLAPEDFGAIAICLAILAIGQIVCDLGLSAAIIQKKKLNCGHVSSAFVANMLAGVALSIIVFTVSGSIGDFFKSQAVSAYLKVIAVTFVISSAGLVQIAQLRRELNFRILARVDFLSAMFGGLAGVLSALGGLEGWSLVIQLCVVSMSTTLLAWLYSKWRPSKTYSLENLRQLWSFGFRMYISALLDIVFARADLFIVGKILPISTLGFFERSKTVNQVLVQNPAITILSVLFPVLSRIQQDVGRLREAVIECNKVLCFLVFMLMGTLYLIAGELFQILFGSEWRVSGEFFKLLVIAGFSYPLSALFLNVIASRGRSKEYLRLEVAKKLLMLFSFILLVSTGIEIYLYSLIITSGLGVVLGSNLVAKDLGIKKTQLLFPILTQCGLALVCIFAAVLITSSFNFDVQWVESGLKVFVFLIMYFAFARVFKLSSFIAVQDHMGRLLADRVWLGDRG